MTINNRYPISLSILISILLLLTTFTITSTLAKHMHTTIMTDSAEVAKFGIEIGEPIELQYISENNPFEHSFSDKGQTLALNFKVTNNKEVTVLCTPYIDSDVQFYISIEDGIYEDFIIEIGETIYFQVIILSNGLSAEATTANLALEIEQL